MSEAADDEATASVSEGLQMIRDDAARQLRHLGERIDQLDVSKLPRFSANLPDELSPQQLVELQRRVADLEPWLQGPFLLAGNYVTPGRWRNDHRWEAIGHLVPDLAGKRVLDVGSNAGYDPFMFHLRGAAEVVALEPFEFIEQARFLESHYHTGVTFEQIGWQRLHPELHGRFDFIHCHGVLYHEPDPLGLLQKLRAMVADDGELLFGSILHASPDASEYVRFVPDAYAGDRTWWFLPGRLAMRWMLEAAGFEAEELLLTEGPRGEFTTMSSYFRCQPTEPASGLTPPAAGPPVRFPAGHYYSPMYDANALRERRSEIWPQTPRTTPDVRWRDEAQVELCRDVFAAADAAGPGAPSGRRRNHLLGRQRSVPGTRRLGAGCDSYGRSSPARMIEVGSGFSSLITARVNREELDGALDFTCIEPYPRGFLTAGVPGITRLREELVQETPLEVFDELGAGDILFIDTSHTVKTGGDVSWIFGEIVPRLAPGVYVHVHDIFLPGEYPEQWVAEGWGWNEIYLVRAFLSYNDTFEVVWGAQYMLQNHHDDVLAAFPGQREYEHRGGGALWLRRTETG